MGSDLTRRERKIYKVVLTGGPCGGKTTGQARLCSFFEKLGWKVLRVPETATVLLGGGIKFSELTTQQGVRFQEELLRTMMQIENTFFSVAESLSTHRDVLVICDRGAMDASAFISKEEWEEILQRNNLNDVDLRDTRYNQVIHMVSAANGAEKFYSIEDHACRSEGLDFAKELDQRAAQAWVGHPYFDMIDNSTDFETKLNRMIQSVCVKLGIDVGDRLHNDSRKVKFLVKGPLPPDSEFPVDFRDFKVVHNYLRSVNGTGDSRTFQGRLRKRGYKNHWSYTHTIRRPLHGQLVEVKTTLSPRDYALMLTQLDVNHFTVHKMRRCFLWNEQYFQMDVYLEPGHPRCTGLILLETYTSLKAEDLYQRLPPFLTIVKEVTGNPRYSMFNLSLRDGWADNKHFWGQGSSNGSGNAVNCNGLGMNKGAVANGLDTPKTNGISNGNGVHHVEKNGAGDDERNEKFLACCDEKSMRHHIGDGGYCVNENGNGMNGHGSQNGTGKFKSYENGKVTNGIPPTGNDSKNN